MGDPGAGGQAGGEILAVFLSDEEVEHGGAALRCGQWAGPGGAERQVAQEGGEVGGGDQVGDAARAGGEVLDAAAGDAALGSGPGPDVGYGRQTDLVQEQVGGEVAGSDNHAFGQPT